MTTSHDPTSIRSALLRFPTAEGRRWLAFGSPVRTITAWRIDEVMASLDEAESAARGGQWVVGMVTYDAAPAFDPSLAAHRNQRLPLLAFGVFDPEMVKATPLPDGGGYELSAWVPSRDQAEFVRDVQTVRGRIGAGDTYQVNYTMRLAAAFGGDPRGLFAALARAQQADHCAYLDLGSHAVCSASPELFFHRVGRKVTCRPMKGTRARHRDPNLDGARARELAASPKDLAENTMIVDMTRNDLGRMAEIGSVTVDRLHQIEQYPTVWQMTSTVSARTDATLAEVFGALFPGASITGAPKISTSRIIAELEGAPRGIYTGAIGALSPDGVTEFNIAIRTVWVDRDAGLAEYGVGGGIVWDSEPRLEWDEADHKAQVLRRSRPDFGLIETLRWHPVDGPALLDRHLARLEASGTHFGVEVDRTAVVAGIAALRADEPRRVRVVVSGNGSVEITDTPIPAPAGRARTLALDSEPVSSDDEFLHHKTTVRGRYEAARDRFPDADDVILWNERGELTESTIANLVLDIDGALVTPAASSGLLPGTMRAELLDQAVITETVVYLDDLWRADRIWLVNSVRGWMEADMRADEPRRSDFTHLAVMSSMARRPLATTSRR